MTRELSFVGLIMVAFGLGSFYATEQFAAYNVVNIAAGSAALLLASIAGLRRFRHAGSSYSRPVVLRGLLGILFALGVAVGLERAAHFSAIQFDWTFERRFEIAPSTRDACNDLPAGLSATLYHDKLDPRIRRTRLLLKTLALVCPLEIDARELDFSSADVDRFGVGSSNTIVLELGDRFETIERPTEGALHEALYRLRSLEGGVIVVLRGEGEGDLEREDDLGFSGLAAALQNEGYELHIIVAAALDEVPEDAKAVLVISPQRQLREEAIAALQQYLERGGRLVAFLEPGVDSGVEALLEQWGMRSPNAVIIDPASGSVESSVRGINPVAYNYSVHPVTQGLNRNRMTFFSGARSFALRKPRVEDKLEGVVLSSPHAWLEEDLSILDRRSGRPEPDGQQPNYHPIVAVGVYEREAGETRIVAIGDSDFASNRYLRAVYNLDLALNAVHWALSRESEITLRPKIGAPLHFPLPIADSLKTLYGVGLLVPELLLIAGGLISLRRRSA